MRRLPLQRAPAALVAALALGAPLAGCGGDAPDPAGNVGAGGATATEPALATAPKRAGEIVVRGELSPASHGPFSLRGRYRVRFEQHAPEDPSLDFGAQTAFVAALDVRPEQEGLGSIALFSASRRSASTVVRADGRYYLDVSFGDFPYVVRLTPLAG